jgi:Protein of unknown function with PCYCGC motif
MWLRSSLWGTVAAVLIGCGCSSPAETVHDHAAAAAAAAPVHSSAPAQSALPDLRVIATDLPPLPDLSGAARPVETVRAVFEFAARHPEVLKYMPCVCGCERMGHQGNDMCFVASRDEAGKVSSWEPHGVICEVCLDIGQDSVRMFNSGASVDAIRKAIDAKYVVAGRTHTPTPMPPHRGGH